MTPQSLNQIPENPLAYFDILHGALHATLCTDQSGGVLALDEGTRRAIEFIVDGKARSAKALLLGNGGSAAIVSHVHNDLMKAVGMRAVVFNEAALLTALTNDDGYETAFETLISKWIEPGDLVIAVSSSGRSANIVRAVQRARSTECFILSFTGFRADNPLRALGNLNFYVPSESYGYVEMAHAVLLHYLTDSAMARGK